MATFEIEANGAKYQIDAPDENAAMSAFQSMSAGPAPADPAPAPRAQQPPPAQPAPQQPSMLSDLAGSLQGGIIRGAAALPGMPATVTGLAETAADNINRQTVGRLYNRFAPGGTGGWDADTRPRQDHWTDALSPSRVLPDSNQTIAAAENLIGKTYRPQTTPGQYVASAGELIGGGVNPLAAAVAGPASELAGQATHGTAYEPYARAAAGALSPAIAGRAITPIRTDPARAPLVDALENEGITLTAGQRTGNKPLQWAESTLSDMPFAGGGAAAAMETQGQQLNSAVARRMGENADMLTPDVMQRASQRIGQQFNDLSARNTLQADHQLTQDLSATATEYSRVLPSQQRETFNNLLTDVVGKFQNGQMPGEDYQQARSRLSRIANSSAQNDPEYGRAVSGLRNALDDAMGRSVAPEDQAAWQTAREQWGNMKTVEKAMGGGGERTAQGYISPLQLRSAAAGNNRQAYVRGQSDLGELGRAAAGAMAPLPNSGTAPRTNIANLVTGLLGGGGAYYGGLEGAAAAAVAPAVMSRALMSRPAQAYLSNRVMEGAGGGTQSALVRALLEYDAGKRRH